MTSARCNTMSKELWQDIGTNADNEALMRRLAHYTKKLVKEVGNKYDSHNSLES